jgi:hypothetical protein
MAKFEGVVPQGAAIRDAGRPSPAQGTHPGGR